MPSNVKKRSRSTGTRLAPSARKSRIVNAAATIRRMGDDWARHWNAGELDGVVAAYAEDAVYLPPHHEAVHGREAIREYLKGRSVIASPGWRLTSPMLSNRDRSPGMWVPTA